MQTSPLPYEIKRLDHSHAAGVKSCIEAVYGPAYADERFYAVAALERALRCGELCSVGAVSLDGTVLAHMALSRHSKAEHPDLGNTVVDPRMRGQGLAWAVGEELTRWCVELGYRGFLHYPTTDHHIMQKQSVKTGYETGLMLSYIPTTMKGAAGAKQSAGRGAATIVFNPLVETDKAAAPRRLYCPRRYRPILDRLMSDVPLRRDLQLVQSSTRRPSTILSSTIFQKRALQRLEVTQIGEDCLLAIEAAIDEEMLCTQIDVPMNDPNIEEACEAMRRVGFIFCGWLPGYRTYDVLRLQRFRREHANEVPEIVNPVARQLLDLCGEELG
ncbi:MAG: GNAT family N-acetyltransferase [Pseudomonadota bacterium]